MPSIFIPAWPIQMLCKVSWLEISRTPFPFGPTDHSEVYADTAKQQFPRPSLNFKLRSFLMALSPCHSEKCGHAHKSMGFLENQFVVLWCGLETTQENDSEVILEYLWRLVLRWQHFVAQNKAPVRSLYVGKTSNHLQLIEKKKTQRIWNILFKIRERKLQCIYTMHDTLSCSPSSSVLPSCTQMFDWIDGEEKEMWKKGHRWAKA